MSLHDTFDPSSIIKNEVVDPAEGIKHPWGLSSLYGYQFFCCPECGFKVHEKQTFVNHAYTDHPDSIDYLSSITDNSLEDVSCPWNETPNNVRIKADDIANEPKIIEDIPSGQYDLNEYSDYDPVDHDDDSSYSTEDDIDGRPKPKRHRGDFSSQDEVQCYLCGHVSAFCNMQVHMTLMHNGLKAKTTKKYGLKRNFQCHECRAMFISKSKLNGHTCRDGEMPNKINGKYPCSECQREFTNSSSYWRHVKTVHSEKRSFKCDQCNYAAKLSILLAKHVEQVHSKTTLDHLCPECGKGFKRAAYLRDHLKRMHKIATPYDNLEEKYLCNQCGRGFKCEVSLKIHEMKIHVKPRKGELVKQNVIDNIVCDEDDLKFNTIQDLNKHMVEAHELSSTMKCDLCDEAWVSTKVLDFHYFLNHEERRFTCDLCFKFFAQKGYLTQHLKYYHQGEERPKYDRKHHKCTECGYKGPKMAHHWKLEHPQVDLPFACNKCDLRTHDKHLLERHIKRTHAQENLEKYQCDQCPFSTIYSSGLEQHIKGVHLDIRDYQCDFCPKSFRAKKTLVLHLVSIHEIVLDDPIQMKRVKESLGPRKEEEIEPRCQKCNKTEFTCVGEFSKHVEDCCGKDINASAEYKCPICEKVWNSPEVLQYHHFKEHGRTVYVCHICGQCIRNKHYLERHIKRVHYNLKEGKCDICHKQFKDGYTVKLHKERVHDKINRFKCDHCDYGCIDRWRLGQHMLSKHTKSPEFKCKYCDFVTHVGKRYRNHVTKEHGPIKNKSLAVLTPSKKQVKENEKSN